ncbi:MAG: septum formation protein Maf [candidate division Zixibacteria bacterium]|nr:septum formation protein Maf [candidate division Zixibacteria bacterium]
MNNRFTIENAIEKSSAEDVKKELTGKSIVLASSSPRRKKVLELLGLEFSIHSPEIEEIMQTGMLPANFAEDMAVKKVSTVLNKFKQSVIIGADTVVVIGSRILGKPKDASDAIRMLRFLRGKEHRVISAIAACTNGTHKIIYSHEVTSVVFKNFSDRDIYDYIDSGEPLDKAGSYGIQGMGSILVDRINGQLDNVIGFPLDCLARLIVEKGQVGNGI